MDEGDEASQGQEQAEAQGQEQAQPEPQPITPEQAEQIVKDGWKPGDQLPESTSTADPGTKPAIAAQQSESGLLPENLRPDDPETVVESSEVGPVVLAANGPFAHPPRPNQPASPGTDANFPVYVGDDLADPKLARDVRLAAQMAHESDPEHFPMLPDSVTFVKDLKPNPVVDLADRIQGTPKKLAGATSWFGGDVELDRDMHLDDKGMLDETKTRDFVDNLLHEMAHLPQSALDRVEMNVQQGLGDATIHENIDAPARDTQRRIYDDYLERRQLLDKPGDYPDGGISAVG